jgi:hypothetical protein
MLLAISDNLCRVTVQMDYQPEGALEQLGDAFGAVRMELRGNLEKFKKMLESRGKETGGWRGSIAQH